MVIEELEESEISKIKTVNGKEVFCESLLCYLTRYVLRNHQNNEINDLFAIH